MIDLDSLKKAGVTVRQFCGLDESEGVGCSHEAVGEIIAQMENGQSVPIPICDTHLEVVMAEFNVEKIQT